MFAVHHSDPTADVDVAVDLLLSLESRSNLVVVLSSRLLLFNQTVFLFAFKLKVLNLTLHEFREVELVPISFDFATRTRDVSLWLIHHRDMVPIVEILRHLLNGDSVVLQIDSVVPVLVINFLPMVVVRHSADFVDANIAEDFGAAIAHFSGQSNDAQTYGTYGLLDKLLLGDVFDDNLVFVHADLI